MSVSALEHHLGTCTDCARRVDDAVRLTRMARLSTADVPDIAERILADAVLPARLVLRRRNRLRLGLAVVGLIQLCVAAPSLFGSNIGGMAMSLHATHEAAAWNAALGIALLATGIRPQRAAGVLSVLATFVAVLALLSVRDLASGATDLTRLATHLGAVAGLVLVAALARAERALPPPREAAGTDRQTGRGPGLRGVA